MILFNAGGAGDEGLGNVADLKMGGCVSDTSFCFDFLSLFGDGHPQQWWVGQSLLAWNAGGNVDQDLDFFVSSSGILTDIAEIPEPGTLMCWASVWLRSASSSGAGWAIAELLPSSSPTARTRRTARAMVAGKLAAGGRPSAREAQSLKRGPRRVDADLPG
jgi:hypothetical protein